MHRSHAQRRHLDALARIPALTACPRTELAAIARHTTPASIPAGFTLCREGETGREAFIIVSGEADVAIGGRTVARLGAGAFCGEMALVERGARSATVTAATAMDLLVMSISEFTSLLASAPCMTRQMAVELSRRLRTADRAVSARHR